MNHDPNSYSRIDRSPSDRKDGYPPLSSNPLTDSPSASATPRKDEPSSEINTVREQLSPDTATDPYVYGDLFPVPVLDTEERRTALGQGRAPSLPIILISAACGVAGGVIGLYISYDLLGFGIAFSAGAATLGLLFALGLSGGILTAATGERGVVMNMAFSCALVALMVLFMTMCVVAGAAIATLLVKA